MSSRYVDELARLTSGRQSQTIAYSDASRQRQTLQGRVKQGTTKWPLSSGANELRTMATLLFYVPDVRRPHRSLSAHFVFSH